MIDPFIIMCAPNGARRQKNDHPNIPITPAELADCAEEILAAGASIMHMHVRDDQGGHSLDVGHYRTAIEAVRARVGDNLIIQVTTEAVGIYSRAEQVLMVKELRPEAISIALREICADADMEADTAEFFTWLAREGIFPQIILYDQQDTVKFERMRRAGIFGCDAPFVLCVLGKYNEEVPDKPHSIASFTHNFSAGLVPWAVCGFGKKEHGLPVEAALSGGHVRVGFENNIWAADGTLAGCNADFVLSAQNSIRALGRKPATANDVRRLFGFA